MMKLAYAHEARLLYFVSLFQILLGFLLFFFVLFLLINKFVLAKRSGGFDYAEFPPGVGDWMRCWFGSDNRGEDGRVPVILRDNKVNHNQV